MKIKIDLQLNEGIRKGPDGYEFDWKNNEESDLVYLTLNPLHGSTLENKPYYFGYKFNKRAEASQIREFRNKLKNEQWEFNQEALFDFLKRPFYELSRKVDPTSFKAIVYQPGHGDKLCLIDTIAESILDVIFEESGGLVDAYSIKLLKNLPNLISFDFKKFEEECGHLQYYTRDLKRINCYLEHLKSGERFQMKQVNPSYIRRYYGNFLIFENKEVEQIYKNLRGCNIMIVEDIKTTGSTIRQMQSLLKNIHEDNNIFVYTLFGN